MSFIQTLLNKNIVRPYKLFGFCVPRLRFLKNAKGRRYLDFGCGDGTVLCQNLAIRPDLKCVAIDIKNFSKDVPTQVHFIQYNGEHIPFKSDSFDIITVNHVLEHLSSPKKTLSELGRILRIQGKIFIETPNKKSLWGKPGGRFGGTVHFKDDPTHIRPYSEKDLIELCKDMGLKAVRSGISRNLLHLILSPALILVGLFMPKTLCFMYARNSIIGWASFVILEKRQT